MFLKNLLSTLLLLAVFATAVASGLPTETSSRSRSVERIKKEVARSVSYPASLVRNHDTEEVFVSFQTEPCGRLTVLEVNASNRAFSEFVTQKLSSLRVEHQESEIFYMHFRFKGK